MKNPKITLEDSPNWRCRCATCIYAGVLDKEERHIDCDKYGELRLKNKRRWCKDYVPYLCRLEKEAQLAVKFLVKYLHQAIQSGQ